MPEWQAFSGTNHKTGLALIATVGLASALSTLALLSFILWNALLAGDKSRSFSRGLRSFTYSSLGCYLISLLICDFLQGIAFALNYRWASLDLMENGKICTVQGAMSEIGDLGAPIWSTAIAFHTFWLLFLVKQPHRLTVPIVTICGWAILIFFSIIGPPVIQRPDRGSFYGLTGAWCWIGPRYGPERLIFLYGWVFAALGCSFVMYSLIYLRFANVITFDHDGKVRLQTRHLFHHQLSPSRELSQVGSVPSAPNDPGKNSGISAHRTHGVDSGSHDTPPPVNARLRRIARRIMWYPAAYAVVVIPVAICRMGVLAGWNPPFPFLVFAGVCFGGSGITNTILFMTTRKSFVMQGANSQPTRIHGTTQHTVAADGSKPNERGIELDSLEFSTTSRAGDTVYSYDDSTRNDSGDGGRIILIGPDHRSGDKCASPQ